MEYFTLLREVTMHFLKRKISLNKVSIAWPDIDNNIEDKHKTDKDKKKNNNKIYTEYTVLETIRHQGFFWPILSVFPFKVITKD